MIEQLPLWLATPIAKIILDKFYEGLGSELAKKAVERLPGTLQVKIQQLGQIVWGRYLRGKPGADKLLQTAADPSAASSAAAQVKLSNYLGNLLKSNTVLQQEAKQLANAIYLEFTQIDDNGSMTQINQHSARGSQIKVSGGTVNVGENYFYGQPPGV